MNNNKFGKTINISKSHNKEKEDFRNTKDIFNGAGLLSSKLNITKENNTQLNNKEIKPLKNLMYKSIFNSSGKKININDEEYNNDNDNDNININKSGNLENSISEKNYKLNNFLNKIQNVKMNKDNIKIKNKITNISSAHPINFHKRIKNNISLQKNITKNMSSNNYTNYNGFRNNNLLKSLDIANNSSFNNFRNLNSFNNFQDEQNKILGTSNTMNKKDFFKTIKEIEDLDISDDKNENKFKIGNINNKNKSSNNNINYDFIVNRNLNNFNKYEKSNSEKNRQLNIDMNDNKLFIENYSCQIYDKDNNKIQRIKNNSSLNKIDKKDKIINIRKNIPDFNKDESYIYSLSNKKSQIIKFPTDNHLFFSEENKFTPQVSKIEKIREINDQLIPSITLNINDNSYKDNLKLNLSNNLKYYNVKNKKNNKKTKTNNNSEKKLNLEELKNELNQKNKLINNYLKIISDYKKTISQLILKNKKLTENSKKTINQVKKYQDEILGLKKENFDLINKNMNTNDYRYNNNEEYIKEIKELKEEIEKYKVENNKLKIMMITNKNQNEENQKRDNLRNILYTSVDINRKNDRKNKINSTSLNSLKKFEEDNFN